MQGDRQIHRGLRLRATREPRLAVAWDMRLTPLSRARLRGAAGGQIQQMK